MSLHKLTAGSGYDYLTRQVAAQDRTEGGRAGLAAYYAEQGEAPGRWVGLGLAGVEGLAGGDEVTADQMQSLFGSGHHPLASQRQASLQGPGLTERDYQTVARLGSPYPVYPGDVSAFRLEVAQRMEKLATSQGHPRDSPLSVDERAQVRTQVAVEFFTAEHGRPPADAREVAATIARHSRQRTTAVAGYDLTFSPVKSISTLWAVAPVEVAAQIEQAHHDAVNDALAFIEKHALYTREGARGVRQVDVTGLVATAFTHRDSRAGDPDLHTHVAVANKVQTLSGKWLAIDGRVLFKANVTASETYNTAIEKHLRTRLGLTFTERGGTVRSKRSIREVVGVDPRLNERWSTRRASIQARRSELATAFQADHGRPPTVIESIHLAQRATLETRDAKHEPRALTEQRTTWAREAREVLGGPDAVTAMVTAALSPTVNPAVPEQVGSAWVGTTSRTVLSTLQAARSTWQVWHVRAEAQREVRAAELHSDQVEAVVDLLVDEVITRRSVRITRAHDDIVEPEELRRRDGSSVYQVAGSTLFTSAEILSAEQRLVEMAGRCDGRRAGEHAVAIALLEQAANGVTLNAGQAALVHGMATSGSRLQLAIAPAGTGKTTAMRALAAAWEEDGGTVIGLAPSAAAAAVLREQLGAGTDTLAKLTWSIAHRDLPDWAHQIGAGTLVLVDEAGMADTLSLAATVDFVLARGGSVRLIGDDQQLAAIGAGGVMGDIAATHGALHLSELLRFVDTAEGAASLALRDGHPEALGFYLDRGRIHVGDLGVITDDVFTAWAHDRGNGLDSIMLAPTRELASQLNQRAQAHRLTGIQPRAGVRLADGNTAYVGEQVITRTNDRRYRIGATDWVKNGDRWAVLAAHSNGSLRVRHVRHGRVITLPGTYVTASTELGYATTVHSAQGVSADTMHGLATGTESRQQLYTMLTRGRHANHLYLQVVGDGDPHTVIRPENLHPGTATDLLQGILVRDASPTSASTMLREHADPATRLADATARYVDALHVAAEHHLGPPTIARLDAGADQVVDGITDDPAWPTLRAHLVLLAASGGDPLTHLQSAAASREFDTAGDRAAVLDWRLDGTSLRNAEPGPLPWLPGIPTSLRAHETWGTYLAARAGLVTDLAAQVHQRTHTAPTPTWACPGRGRPNPDILAAVTVWRAATGVHDSDQRPTGPKQLAKATALWQRALDARVIGGHSPALAEWGALLEAIAPTVRSDAFTPVLAERLAAVSRSGLAAHRFLQAAVAEGDLPDDHAAAALWWRISRHLSPAVANRVDERHDLTPTWTARLSTSLGPDRAAQLQDSPWWPSLVTVIEHALARGQALAGVIGMVGAIDRAVDVDRCQALVWRLSVLTDQPTSLDQGETPPPPPEDIDAEMPADAGPWWPADQSHLVEAPTPDQWAQLSPGSQGQGTPPDHDTLPDDMVTDLAAAAVYRQSMGVLEPTDAQIQRMLNRAAAWDHAVADQRRMTQIHAMAMDFYAARVDTGWAGFYLDDRLPGWRTSPHVTAGYAPASWTALVDHLGGRGVTNDELLETGLATRARTGTIIDRFRDRAILPITHEHQILGFVARRHPKLTEDDRWGPKYLNTADTVLFHKGAQLHGVTTELLDHGAVPVLVEGPIDALAVTLSGHGHYVGVAPLGTALTDEQARELATLSTHPVVATDADLAGRIAAERAFWLLAQHGADPLAVDIPEGADPASVLHNHGPAALLELLGSARPLGAMLIDERLANLPTNAAVNSAARVIAASPPTSWVAQIRTLQRRTASPLESIAGLVRTAATRWNNAPAEVANEHLAESTTIQVRLARTQDPLSRWISLAEDIHDGLSSEPDWPALAYVLQSLADSDLDVAHVTRAAVDRRALSDRPAQDLRYRLIGLLPPPPNNDLPLDCATAPGVVSHRHQQPGRHPSMHSHSRSNR
ncbi:MobF family relaxase [Knoellia sp. S7-12]|uniref:MobF family relaxase n=1 Tax=Knoellia sp. S7-12 TaxID=3126698 RepID=UPI0033666AA3